MREITRLALTLMIISAVAAGALAITNARTSEIIAKRLEQERIEQMQSLFPAVDEVKPREVDGRTATVGYAGGKLTGVVYEGRTGGYGGTIIFTLAVDADGKIVDLQINDHSETPGLGSKITEDGFRKQFVGKTADDAFAVGKDIDSISGATVSARAMASGVKQELQEIMDIFIAGGK
ncbi:MAG: FMN-binding protein [Dethiobacter sp.]|jgi:electron transport complex protein RnfG|nr:FMN-binding protein [Dethiobacter sp.]